MLGALKRTVAADGDTLRAEGALAAGEVDARVVAATLDDDVGRADVDTGGTARAAGDEYLLVERPGRADRVRLSGKVAAQELSSGRSHGRILSLRKDYRNAGPPARQQTTRL